MGVRARALEQRFQPLGYYLVFKVVERLSENWPAPGGGQNLMALVLKGYVFRDGLRKECAAALQPASVAA